MHFAHQEEHLEDKRDWLRKRRGGVRDYPTGAKNSGGNVPYDISG